MCLEGAKSSEAEVSVLLAQYSDNTEHRRHHEQERSTANNVFVTLAAALVGITANGGLEKDDVGWAIALTGVGAYGLILNWKLTQLSEFHLSRAQALRRRLNDIVQTEQARVLIESNDRAHKKEWWLTSKLRLRYLWMTVTMAITLSGATLTYLCSRMTVETPLKHADAIQSSPTKSNPSLPFEPKTR